MSSKLYECYQFLVLSPVIVKNLKQGLLTLADLIEEPVIKKKHSQASVLVTLIVINMGQLQNGDIVEVLVTSVFESLLPVVDLWKLNTDK